MEWYRISSLHAGTVDVEADNWLAALGIGLGKLGKVHDLTRLAAETLPNGAILVRDARTGQGYAVAMIPREDAPLDDPTEESELEPIAEEVLPVPVGLDDYVAAVRSAIDAEAAIARTFAALRDLAPAESGTVLRRHTDDWLGFEGAFGPGADRLSGVALPPGTGIAGFCVQRLLTVSVRDAYADPRFFRQLDTFTGYTTRTLLCVPLVHDHVTYGCLELINARSEKGFSREAMADTEALANALADRLAREPMPLPPTAR
jgi:hypothetical protein